MSKQKRLVPKLRFPEFRDGGAWEECKINNFVESYKGGASLTPKDFELKSDYEVIPKKSICAGGWLNIDTENSTYCSKKFFNNNGQSIVDSTYLITTLRDLVPSGPSIGYIVKYTGDKKYILAQGVYGLKPKDLFVSEFLIHFSNTDQYRNLVNSVMVGSTQVHIRNGDFLQLPIYVPLPQEQKKIADCLSSLDKLITAHSQKHEALKAHKKGLMQQLFPTKGETTPKLRFPEFRDVGEWEETTLGKTVKFLDGKRKPIKELDRATMQGQFPYYGASGIIDYVNNFIFDEDLILLGEDGENIVSRNLPLVFKVSGKCWVNNHAHVLQPIKPHCLDFLVQYMESLSYLKYNSGGAQPKLNQAVCKTIPLILPLPKEQKKIADCLSSIDELITTQSQKIETLKAHKRGLMQQLFPCTDEVNG